MGAGFDVAGNDSLKIPTGNTSIIEKNIVALILQILIDRQGSVHICPPVTDKYGLLNACHLSLPLLAQLYVKRSDLQKDSVLAAHQLLHQGLRHLHSDHFSAHGDLTVGDDPFFDDDFASFELFYFSAYFELHTKWRGF